ncbi:MAG: sulfite exporter TauE/SafE family protein [Rubrivivax sp.]
MSGELWLIIAGAATAGFVQGLSGFAFSLVSLSFWAWGLEPQRAAVLATVGGLTGQILAALAVRRGSRWRTLWPFIAGGLCGIPVGVLLLPHIELRAFKLLIGGLLVVWCPLMLFGSRLPQVRGGRAADAAAGAIGGLMGPLGGFTGAVPTLWCTLRGMDRDEQRAVVQNFNLTMLAVSTAAYLQRGLITPALYADLGLVAASLTLPALLGMRVYIGISPLAFRQVVLSLLTLSGLAMLASALRS